MRQARPALAFLAGVVVAISLPLSGLAQSSNDTGDGANTPAAVPAAASAPADNQDDSGDTPEQKAPTNAVHAQAPPPPPTAPPVPVRSPAAILQALDKVTAETLRFAVPIGQKVRYKNLVFTVKACETSGLGSPSPEASAYVTIVSAPLGAQGFAPPPPKEVFHGWMFANSPGLNPFQHPVYDAWLIACMAAPPPA